MKIGIDIDNVIADLDKTFLEEFEREDKNKRNKGIINKNAKHITEGMFDWNSEEIEDFICNNMDRMAEKFDLIEGAKEYINKLYEENEIFLITHRSNHFFNNHELVTINWLNEKGIKYDKLVFTKSKDKSPECIENGVDIMFDDEADNCKCVLNAGIECFLMKTRYNENYSLNIPIINGWKEIYSLICKKNKYNVILDTDTYNECDDQFELAYLLKNQDKFNIEAITVAPYSHQSRNVSVREGQGLSYNEILKICKWLNFNINNKVFKGSTDYICNGYNETNDSVNKIVEIALKNNKTYILEIGAITNVALAIKKEPKIINKIEIIWLGGNELGYKDNLEYNFKQDIEAVKIVFNSKVKMTVLPCKNVVSDLRIDINTLKNNLENKSELCNYLIERFYNDGYHGIQETRVIWDISAIAYMINKNWFEIKEISCPNIKEDSSYELTDNRHIITFVTKLDRDKIYNDLFKKLGGN